VLDIGTLGGRFTEITDMNEAGEIVGYSETAAGQIHAFVYTQGTLHDLGSLGGGGSLASAINDAGQITGFSLTATGEAHAFLYAAGSMNDLGTTGITSSGKALNAAGQIAGEISRPDGQLDAMLYSNHGGMHDLGAIGGSSSTSEAINKAAQVTGTYEDSTGSHAFLYSHGSMADLTPGNSSFVSGTRTINDAGAVAGTVQTDQTMRGFVYMHGHATDIGTLGADYTVATAINRAGNVTGISAKTDGERHAFIYSGGMMTDVGTLGGSFSVGYALNDSNQVAGQSMTASGALHAFVSRNGTLLDLGQLVEALAPAGTVVESVAIGINRAGEVIGRYTISDPADAQMPKKTRGFVAAASTASVVSLFDDLIATVTGLGRGKSLEKKLQEALAHYLVHDINGSCSQLNAFTHEVNAQDGKKIEHATALQLIQQAGAISGAVGCP